MQAIAAEIAMVLDDRAAGRQTVEDLKMALVSSNPTFWVEKLYPEAVSSGPPEGEEDEELDTEGTWVMPEITEEEFLSMERELAQRGGLLNLEDLEEIEALEEEGEWQ